MNNRWRRVEKHLSKERKEKVYKIHYPGVKRPEIVFDINGGLFTVAYSGHTYKSPSFRKGVKHYAIKRTY